MTNSLYTIEQSFEDDSEFSVQILLDDQYRAWGYGSTHDKALQRAIMNALALSNKFKL